MSRVALCRLDSCNNLAHGGENSMCSMHRSRMWRYRSPELPTLPQRRKICKFCDNEFIDTDKCQRSLICSECRKTKWKYYKNRTWENSTKGKEYMRAFHTRYKAELKKIIYDYYGWVCNCCGESTEEFLTIDHVLNDGHIDRKKNLRGTSFYRKVIASGLPSTYQILCMNCNFGKKITGGVCPHQLQK